MRWSAVFFRKSSSFACDNSLGLISDGGVFFSMVMSLVWSLSRVAVSRSMEDDGLNASAGPGKAAPSPAVRNKLVPGTDGAVLVSPGTRSGGLDDERRNEGMLNLGMLNLGRLKPDMLGMLHALKGALDPNGAVVGLRKVNTPRFTSIDWLWYVCGNAETLSNSIRIWSIVGT